MYTRNRKMSVVAWAIIVLVIIADQACKFWVKTSFYLGEDYEILPWFHLHFVQNNGMAFGLDFINKYILTSLRILLFGYLAWYIVRLCRLGRAPWGYLVSVALVAAGAVGNIIDCVFYGEIFTNPMPPQVAQIVPWGEGYGTFFQGFVVDMFWLPLFSFDWPQWMPLLGGKTFSFFDPVFNVADAAISVGMIAVVLFYFRYMEHSLDDDNTKDNSDIRS